MRSSIAQQPAGQMALGQQEPVVPGVLHKTPAALDQPLLETGERPGLDARRQHQPPPQIPEVVGEHTRLQVHLVGPEPVTRKPRPVRGLLALLDLLLRGPALVVESDDGPTRERQVRHDEPDAQEQLTGVVLDLRDDAARAYPGCRLVREALVPHERSTTGPSTRTKRRSSIASSRFRFAGMRIA